MSDEYKKYCGELIKSGNYSKCFVREAAYLYCSDLKSLKRVIETRNLTKVKPISNR